MASSRKSRFPHICVVTFLCILLAGLGGLVCLWNYLEEYEKSTPQYAAGELLDLYRTGDFSAAMNLVGVDAKQFFDDKQYPAYIKDTLGNLDTVRTVEGSADGKKTLSLRGESGKSLRFQLVNGNKRLSYGMVSLALRQEPIPLSGLTIRAPSHASVTVNGTTLTDEYQTGDATVSQQFPILRDSSRMPTETVYQIDGLILEPQLALEGKTEADYHLARSKDTAEFTMLPTTSVRQQYEALALETAQVYAKFISHDAQFTDLEKYLYKDTDFYSAIRSFSNKWYSSHTGVRFEDLTVNNTVEYSPDHFSSEVSFDYVVYRGNAAKPSQEWHYPTKYRLYFLRTNDNWKAVEIDSL